jgi:hypothetical protein
MFTSGIYRIQYGKDVPAEAIDRIDSLGFGERVPMSSDDPATAWQMSMRPRGRLHRPRVGLLLQRPYTAYCEHYPFRQPLIAVIKVWGLFNFGPVHLSHLG